MLKRFRAETDGAVAVIVALTLVMLMGFVALGIDTASLYRERHKLQTVTDLAALSAVPDPTAARDRAAVAKTTNGLPDAAVEEVILGRYLRNPALPAGARFSPLPEGAPGINAVSVRLRNDAPLSFGRILTDEDHVTLRSTAMAARTGAISFSLDSGLAQFDGAVLASLLTSTYSSSVQLSAADVTVLAETQISVGDILAVLASELGFSNANPAEILNQSATPAQVLAAMRQLAPDLERTLDALTGAESETLIIAEIVGGLDTELGLTVLELVDSLDVSALDLLMAVAGATRSGDPMTLDTQAAVPGLLTQSVTVTAAEPPAHSGWITMGEPGVTLSRAAMRLDLDTEFDPSLLAPLLTNVAATRLRVPVFLELAGATATLDRMSCNEDPSSRAAEFVTAPTPLDPSNGTAIAALYIGDLSGSDFARTGRIAPSDLGYADVLEMHITIPVPLLPDIIVGPLTLQMRSSVTVGQSDTDRISFTRADIEAGRTQQSFGSETLLTSSVSDLLSADTTDIRFKPGQDGLVSQLSAGLLNSLESMLPGVIADTLTAPLDGVLDATLASLGIQVGAGVLTVEALHCERALLVR